MDEKKDLMSVLAAKMPSLSKGQKCIANFLIDHYDKAIYLTAAKLGETTGVSESTVVRFALEMGYDGYPKLQQALKELVKTKLTATQRVAVSTDRLNKSGKHILKTVLQGDADKIMSTLQDIDEKAFDGSAEELANADKVYIIGGRSAAGIADFFSFYLHLMRENVVHINSSASAELFEQIFRIKKGDVCVGISFPRYSQRTIKAMEYACAQDATVIAITDSGDSPIAHFANYCLTARSDMISFADSLVAPLSVINALLVAVSVKKKNEVLETLDKLENLWQEYNVYSQEEDKN